MKNKVRSRAIQFISGAALAAFILTGATVGAFASDVMMVDTKTHLGHTAKVVARDAGRAVDRGIVRAAETTGNVSKDTAVGVERGVHRSGKAVAAGAKGIGRFSKAAGKTTSRFLRGNGRSA